MSNIENLNRRGRKPGSKNKSVVNKTQIFRDAFTEEKVKAIAYNLFSIMEDDTQKASDRIHAANTILRYTVHTADTEMVVDSEAAKPSAESMAKALALVEAASK